MEPKPSELYSHSIYWRELRLFVPGFKEPQLKGERTSCCSFGGYSLGKVPEFQSHRIDMVSMARKLWFLVSELGFPWW